MRNVILGMMIAACMAVGGLSTASAAPAGTGGPSMATVADGLLQKADYSGYCERLRRACIYREERGEVGEGNCRRYHNECGRENRCESLRRACIYKEERGQEGQGNCRRYHNECGY